MNQLSRQSTTIRTGIYVDSANIALNGGYGMQYEVLRELGNHDNGEVMRLNAYLAYDHERGEREPDYRRRTRNFFATLRDIGYKVIEKRVRRYVDDEGNVAKKSNSDLDMAVDALTQSGKLDRVILVTGDGDFCQVARALQDQGCRVELVAFTNVSTGLRQEVDMFIPGYIIPNLLPVENAPDVPWGQLGSRVRGYCYFFSEAKHFGFMRFLNSFDKDLHITDTKNERTPFLTAFFHESSLPGRMNRGDLPSREVFFEFDLAEGKEPGQLEAHNVTIAGALPAVDE